jgi:hypothetical protein
MGISLHVPSNIEPRGYKPLCKSITSNEIEIVIISLLRKRSPIPDGITAAYYQGVKEQPMQYLLKLFHKTDKEGVLPHSFYEASITLMSKAEKETTKRKL